MLKTKICILSLIFCLSLPLYGSKVDYLLEMIEQSDAQFERNGRKHSASRARGHLQRKWTTANRRHNNLTSEDFIDQIASRSSRSGQAYLIHLPSGEVVELGLWLREIKSSKMPGES